VRKKLLPPRCSDIGARQRRPSQNAAKPVMRPDLWPEVQHWGRRGTINGAYSSREARRCRSGRDEEALQQKRIERERADRDAPRKTIFA